MEKVSLSARRLVQVFGSGDNEVHALRGVSLGLTPGQLSLVMGPSGCGKTTLLAILSGLQAPTSGEVLVGDRNLCAMSPGERREFRRQHVGFIFQGFALFPTLTVREQLEIVLRWGERVSSDEAGRRTEELLDVLDLTPKADLFPRHLSGGEQQRLAIGRALIKKPDLLFADEPTSALDGEHGKQVMEILSRAAHEQFATVLVVTHDPRVLSFGDRIFYLEDGALKDSKAPLAKALAIVPKLPPDREERLVHS